MNSLISALIGSVKSKTNWTAVGIAVLTAVNEPVQQWIAAHPSKAGSLVALAMLILRTMTTTSLADKA